METAISDLASFKEKNRRMKEEIDAKQITLDR
jgi:hypothetical protein